MTSSLTLGYISELEKISLALFGATINHQAILAEYRQQINNICSSILRDENHDGMIGLLCILQDGIDKIIRDVTLLSDERLHFLVRIPGYISEYMMFPESKMPCSVMVRHMSSKCWVRPLSATEQQYYLDNITHKYAGQVSNDDVAPLVMSLHDFSVVAASDGMDSVSIDDLLSIPDQSNENDKQHINLDALINLYEDESVAVSAIEAAVLLPDYAMPAQADTDHPEPCEKIKELIDLVTAELAEIVEFYHSNLVADEVDINAVIKEAAVLVGNIANAVKLIGLGALSDLCEEFSNVFDQVNFVQSKPITAVADNLETWPQLLLNYLQSGFSIDASQRLVNYLGDNDLIAVADESSKQLLVDRLANPVFPEEDKQIRYDSASLDDVDLSLPEDVNPELLESLLQDLPRQTEELTTALLTMRDASDTASIEIAQRIAHTLKGSANVVGVKGIANISHHLEDILEHLTKSRRMPSAPLMEVLMASSDCIESMADSLLGYDSPPEHALEILQTILNWSNKINEQGLDAVIDNTAGGFEKPLAAIQPGYALTEKNKSQISAPVENSLRIPAHLADDLLRLAGENLITTGQIQESIKNSLNKQGLLKNHNRLLQQLAFDLEHLIDIQGITSNFSREVVNDKFDSLELDEYQELHTISRRLIEIAADSLALTNDLNTDLTDLHNLVISHGVIQKENQDLVLRTRMLPVKSMIPRLKRGIRQVCRLTGKEVDLEILDNDVYLDSEVINELIEPLMHLLRNAVDHGIESVVVRKNLGKPSNGTIQVVFLRMGDSVQINIADDGQGLDVDKIYVKAVAQNLIKSGAEFSIEETYRLILLHGFSTRDEATQVSGRGVGLDAVSVKIRELKGSIDIASIKGEGCTFKLSLPVSSFSTHSLLVRIRRNVYAISSRGIEEILFPGTGELVDCDNGMQYVIEGQSYHALVIDDLFDLERDRRVIERNLRPVLLVRNELGGKTAVLVQEVLDSRHVVVKPLGMYLPRLKGIVGSTILGDGSVAPVIDMPELLLDATVYQPAGDQLEHHPAVGARSLPYVLVVDDSLSARRSLMHFVQDLGLEVREARDGIEAASMISMRRPDLMLVDMEMPRMNGLELTSHIRTSYDAQTLPVIMITSRSSEKHRKAAMDQGVNHFLVKPFAEEELAQHINNFLTSN